MVAVIAAQSSRDVLRGLVNNAVIPALLERILREQHFESVSGGHASMFPTRREPTPLAGEHGLEIKRGVGTT